MLRRPILKGAREVDRTRQIAIRVQVHPSLRWIPRLMRPRKAHLKEERVIIALAGGNPVDG